MKTSFHRQNKNKAETEQEEQGDGGVMGGLLCPHDPHRLQVHLWGQRWQRRARLEIPEPDHWNTQARHQGLQRG